MAKKIAIITSITFVAALIIGIVLRIFVFPKILDRGQKRQNINYPLLVYEQEVSEKLHKLGIPHKIDKTGSLLYSRFNQKIIESVYKEVDRKYFPEWDNFSFRIEKFQNRLKQLLKENEIPFIIRKLDADGHEYILWDPLYNEKAIAVKESVLQNMTN